MKKRFCKRCNKIFVVESKYNFICEACKLPVGKRKSETTTMKCKICNTNFKTLATLNRKHCSDCNGWISNRVSYYLKRFIEPREDELMTLVGEIRAELKEIREYLESNPKNHQ